MTDAEFLLTPIAYAGSLSIDLNVPNLPSLVPKAYVGLNVIGTFFEQMALEVLYLQTILRTTVFPIHMTDAQKKARYEVTHCGGCHRKFESDADINAHHRHSQAENNFLG